MSFHSPGPSAARLASGYYALGGGLAGLLIHLFIWRMIWRLVMLLWRIPTFGPVIVGLLVAGAVALAVLRAAGRRPPWRRRGGGYGYGTGPRDW